MNAILVVIRLKAEQFPLEICRSPEQDLVEELAPYRSDQSFNERMGKRHMRHGPYLRHLEDAKVGLPGPEFEERIAIIAEMGWQDVPPRNDLAKLATKGKSPHICPCEILADRNATHGLSGWRR